MKKNVDSVGAVERHDGGVVVEGSVPNESKSDSNQSPTTSQSANPPAQRRHGTRTPPSQRRASEPTPARRPPPATLFCSPRNRIPPVARPRERCGGRRAGRACRRAATRPRPRRATTATARRSRRSTRSRRRAGGRRRGPGRWGAPCTASRCCCYSAPSCSGSPPPPPPRFTSTDNRRVCQMDLKSGFHGVSPKGYSEVDQE